MNPADLIVPLFLLCGTVLVAPHLTWSEARVMVVFCLVAAFVFFIILGVK